MQRITLQIQEWEKHAKEADYSSKNLAALCSVSPRQLRRRFLHALGCSPQQWLDELRLTLAKLLLMAGVSIKEAAAELRFKQVGHFCRKFKDRYHITPTEFVIAKQRQKEQSEDRTSFAE
jgi:AraC-like DNA-binding protein